MLIEPLNLSDSSRILKFCYSILFDGKNNAVITGYGDRSTSTVHSFEGVLHLEELSIGREDRIGFVVGGHLLLFLLTYSLASFFLPIYLKLLTKKITTRTESYQQF